MMMHMKEDIVPLIARLMEGAATSLGSSLEQLGYPNKCRNDAPFNEANVIAHLTATLRAQYQGSLFYAEIPITGGGRIDLFARVENFNLLIEAKGLGGVERCADLRKQLIRFDQFAPSCTPRKDKKQYDYWCNSPAFGLAVIGSHAGISEAWKPSGSSEVANLFSEKLSKPKSAAKARREAGSLEPLLNYLDARGSIFGVQSVLDGNFFEGTDSLDLLWAIFPLPRHADCEVTKK